MGRVIWKARDTPGSWEVLHTSQASTSWLLSTSVYQVKVANSPNWPLKCKMQYMFDVVRYEVNERKVKAVTQESNPGPVVWAVSALTTELLPPGSHQLSQSSVWQFASIVCPAAIQSDMLSFHSLTTSSMSVCSSWDKNIRTFNSFLTVSEIERFCVESDLLSQAACIQRIPTAVTIVWWFPVL